MLDPIGYRWRKQQKKGTLSHIPVELADIRAATQSGSYSDVDDNSTSLPTSYPIPVTLPVTYQSPYQLLHIKVKVTKICKNFSCEKKSHNTVILG